MCYHADFLRQILAGDSWFIHPSIPCQL